MDKKLISHTRNRIYYVGKITVAEFCLVMVVVNFDFFGYFLLLKLIDEMDEII